MANKNENPTTEDVTPLQSLIVEDSRDDFELSVRALECAGLNINAVQVASREELQNLIAANCYHIIFSDDNLRGWTGMEALEFLKQQGNDTPFILVCDAVGEERAVEYIKAGAADLVWKSRLSALPGAVWKVISDKAIRDARKRAEDSLRESESRFRALADSIASAVLIYQGTACRYANRAAQILTGYAEKELLDLSSWDLVHPDSRSLVIEHGFLRVREAQSSTRYEAKILTRQGEVRVWDVTVGRIELQGRPAGLITALDVTDRKLAEAASEQSGSRDSLTGLLSSTQAQNIFLVEAKRSERTGRSFALLLLKLDELKQIKERSEFAEASRVLCKLARVVGEVCRSADSAARLSDDEFLLLLPETSLAGVRRLVQRIGERLHAESREPVHQGTDQVHRDSAPEAGPLPPATYAAPVAVSAGVAVFPQDGPTLDHALRSARRILKTIPTESSAKELAHSA